MSSDATFELDNALDPERRAVLRDLASHLIPAGHGMPAAGDVVDDPRIAFVLHARPDLVEALRAALRPELGDDPGTRLATLAAGDPESASALQFAVVAGYYTDTAVRAAIGYPGQVAKPVTAFAFPAYIEEGLIDGVLERGPIWRDPAAAVTREDG